MNNVVSFHEESGIGYQFLGSIIKKIDQQNETQRKNRNTKESLKRREQHRLINGLYPDKEPKTGDPVKFVQ